MKKLLLDLGSPIFLDAAHSWGGCCVYIDYITGGRLNNK
ncbi:hypothetical protein YERSI8AC_310015 [Enterobacterales bacterium 8AC]|nr:hypothetical protein YERSI8AC_310015 [Enterobacterales bacterium 8AC]